MTVTTEAQTPFYMRFAGEYPAAVSIVIMAELSMIPLRGLCRKVMPRLSCVTIVLHFDPLLHS